MEEQNNYDFTPLSKMASAVAKSFSTIVLNTDLITESFKTMSNQLSQSVKALFELYNADIFENLKRSFKIFADGVLLAKLQTMGNLGWCNIDAWIKPESIDILEDNTTEMSSVVLLRMNREEDFDIASADRFIGRHLTKEIIKTIEVDTIPSLDENDGIKLKKAMIDFRARRYMDCANLLASLIDAQSIKQELFDIKNNRISEEFYDSKNNKYVTKQGLEAFHRVFKSNFSKYFDGEHFGGRDKRKSFDGFVDNIKGNICSEREDDLMAIVGLSCCLLKLFENSDFTVYPEFVPSVINRHWLMHGMYDIDDIDRYDCIKLLLMLNQISKVYGKLKAGEL